MAYEKNNLLADKSAIDACIELTKSSPEAARYFQDRLRERLIQTKMLDKCTTGVMEPIEKFVANVEVQGTRETPWTGNKVKSDFENLNANIGDDAAKQLSAESKGPFRMDIAIDAQSNFLRGFAEDGKPAAKEKTVALDSLFNSWLAQNNIANKSSTFFKVNSEGENLKDEKGNLIRVSADEMKKLIADKDAGFQKYGEDKGLQLSARQLAYPKQATAEVKPQAPAPSQPSQPAQAPQVAPDEVVEPTPASNVSSNM